MHPHQQPKCACASPVLAALVRGHDPAAMERLAARLNPAANEEQPTIAELWEKRNQQDRKRQRNRILLAVVYLFLFTAIGVLLAWPNP